MIVVKLEADIQWKVRRSETSNRWVAVCDPMNLSMEAESLDEMHGLINETMQTVFFDLLHDGELDLFLKQRGWNTNNPFADTKNDDVEFDVPWDMITRNSTIDPERRSN